MGQRPDEVGSGLRLGDDDLSARTTYGTDATYDADATRVTDSEDTPTPETEEIRAQIEETRAGMSQTIDQITERLSPTNIKEQVKEQVIEGYEEVKDTVRDATIGRVEDMVRYAGDTVEDVRTGTWETIRSNPIPAALTALGLGWLWMNRKSGHHNRGVGGRARYYEVGYDRGRESYGGRESYSNRGYDDRGGYTARYSAPDRGYEERGYRGQGGSYSGSMDRVRDTAGSMAGQASSTVSNAASQARDAAGNVVDQAQETVSNLASGAQERAGQVVDTVQETASDVYERGAYYADRLEDRFQQQLGENPLVVGAISLALGAAVGMAVPNTRKENEWMGEARDTLVERATERASDVATQAMDKVQNVAGQVQGVAGQVLNQAEGVKQTAKEHGSAS